jgi:2-keto-3-deoxy-L-rhamnonate aldolase RhmA
MTPSFRDRLRRGDRLIGTIVTLDCPEVAEILAAAGFDWLFVDAEHAPLTTIAMQRLLMAAGDLPCVIRLADDNDTSIKKALDIGAAGIIVPQVNSAEQAATVVRRAKYAPAGSRGIGLARANTYGSNLPEYIAQANGTTAVIVQAEHIDAVGQIDGIAAVEGLDAVFIGPNDLAASMNKTGQFGDPEVVAAIERVTEACKARNMRLGIFGASADAIAPHIETGYTLLACSVDTLLLGRAAGALYDALSKKP